MPPVSLAAHCSPAARDRQPTAPGGSPVPCCSRFPLPLGSTGLTHVGSWGQVLRLFTFTHTHTTRWECLGKGCTVLLWLEVGSHSLTPSSSSLSPAVSGKVLEGNFRAEDWMGWVKARGDRRKGGVRNGSRASTTWGSGRKQGALAGLGGARTGGWGTEEQRRCGAGGPAHWQVVRPVQGPCLGGPG